MKYCLHLIICERGDFVHNAEINLTHWVYINQKRAGAGTDTLMGAGAFYMPVISQGNVLGVIGLSCINGLLSQ